MERTLSYLIGIVWVSLAAWIFLFSGFDGDIDYFINQVFLNKIHLSHEWSIPYFTPALCRGFLLAADPENPLFTVFQLLSFFFRDQTLALQVGMFGLTLVLGLGFCRWLPWLGVRDSKTRLLAGAALSISGYWVSHLKVGHLTFHGIAFLPWLMIELEKIRSGRWASPLRSFLALTALLFLLLNSGHAWIQVFLPLLLGRLTSELLTSYRDLRPLLRTLILFFFASCFAAILSAPRLTGIFSISFERFPREMPILGVINSTRLAGLAVLRSLSDPRVLLDHLTNPHTGSWWEWSAYVSVLGLPIAVIGAMRRRFNPSFIGLIIAALISLILLRFPAAAQGLRWALPPLENLSFFFRGVMVITFLLFALLAKGLDGQPARRVAIIAALVFVDLTAVYWNSHLLKPLPPVYREASYQIPTQLTTHIGWGATGHLAGGDLGGMSQGLSHPWCYNGMVGYKEENFHTQTIQGDVFSSPVPGFLNMNDIDALLVSPVEPRDRFKTERWPLWPENQREKLEQFSRFRQTVALPPSFAIASRLSIIALFIFGLLIFVETRRARRS